MVIVATGNGEVLVAVIKPGDQRVLPDHRLAVGGVVAVGVGEVGLFQLIVAWAGCTAKVAQAECPVTAPTVGSSAEGVAQFSMSSLVVGL